MKILQSNVFLSETTQVKLISLILLKDLTNMYAAGVMMNEVLWCLHTFLKNTILSFYAHSCLPFPYHTEILCFPFCLWRCHCRYLIHLILYFIVTPTLSPYQERTIRGWKIKFSSIANFLQVFTKSLSFLCSSSFLSLK